MNTMTGRNLSIAGLILVAFLGSLIGCSTRKKVNVCGMATQPMDIEEQPRYVVVLSLDGFRADYQSMTHTPNLDAMDREGLSGAFRPCYPSLTFPNHYSMATGLHPNNHGLVGNEFWDEKGRHYKLGNRKAVEDPTFYYGEPLWNTARRHGLKTASYYWVGSETPIGGHQPDRWKRYDSRVPYRDRADSVISWLNAPIDSRPRLIMWYLDEPDHTGHHYSPEAEETKTMIRSVDSVVGYFRHRLTELPIASQVDFILVSDHGMQTYDRSKEVNLADYLPLDSFVHVATGPFTHLYPKPGYLETAYNKLKSVPNVQVYKKAELPKRLHFGSSPRIGELVVMANLGTQIYFAPEGRKVSRLAAGHGFDNKHESMLALFKAVGTSFDAGRRVDQPVPNITLYPLVCQLLKMQPAPHDADEELARSLIRSVQKN